MAFLDAAGVTRLCQDLKSRFAAASHTHSEYQVKLVSGTSIKTVNGASLLGSGNIDTSELPTVTSSDDGKVLQVSNGAWAAASAPSGGGASVMTLYLNSSKNVLYVDAALTTTLIEYYGWDTQVAADAIQAADIIKIKYSSDGVDKTFFASLFYLEPVEEERKLFFTDYDGTSYGVDITWE